MENEIIEMTEEEFNKQYPDAFEEDGTTCKFENIPYKKFLLTNAKSQVQPFIAIDNTDGYAWTEEFHWNEKDLAIRWLNDECTDEELRYIAYNNGER